MFSALNRKLLRETARLKGQIATIAIVVASGIVCFISMRGTYASLRESELDYYDRYHFADVFAQVERAPETLARRIAPLWLAVLGVVLANLVFSSHNPDPLATEVARIGPLRVTQEAVAAAAGLGARVISIISVGAVFALTTDATLLIDSLVQLAHVSPRFAYGTLAAYQAVPKLADDLGTLRAARRLRGLREWHPRLIIGMLVRAIRHADQLAIAMDARGFGSGPRTTYRPVRWQPLDALVGASALAILVVALLLAR